jgi:flagellar biosynthesis GTPase FlhF
MKSRTSAALGAAALIVAWLGVAHGQGFGGTASDPCTAAPSAASPFGMLVNAIVQQQRERACLQQRQAQWDQYNAKQKAAKEAAAADAAQAKARQAEADEAKAQAQEKARAEQAAANARAARKRAAAQEVARAEERRPRIRPTIIAAIRISRKR